MIYRYENCTVLRVHDGDTIACDIDMGLSLTRRDMSIRFAGINAPELKTPEGVASRDFLLTLVKPGDVVTLESLGWDKYNRLDARVLLPGSLSGSAGAQMVAAGQAVLLGPYTP